MRLITRQGPCGDHSFSPIAQPYSLEFPSPVQTINLWYTNGNPGLVVNIEFVCPEPDGSQWVNTNPAQLEPGGGALLASIGIPSGSALVGVTGNYTGVINMISFLLYDATTKTLTSVGPYGGMTTDGSGVAFTLTIPSGTTLTGVFGQVGSQVNTIGLIYSPGQY